MHSLYLLGFLLQFSLKRWKEIDYKLKTHEWKLIRTFLFIQKCNQILGPFIFKRDRFCIDILDVWNSWKMQFKPLRMEASIHKNNFVSIFLKQIPLFCFKIRYSRNRKYVKNWLTQCLDCKVVPLFSDWNSDVDRDSFNMILHS